MGGHYVRLYAPRKYGKTSLLKRALRDGEVTEGLIPVHVDLYRVSSIADVTVRFERAYSQHLKGAIRGRVEDFLQKTGIGLSLGAYGISAKLQLNPKSDPLPALHALLDLPLRLEASGGYRAFIALDEFQDIDKVPDLDGLIRSHIQYHGEVASYVFAGSEPGLMRQPVRRAGTARSTGRPSRCDASGSPPTTSRPTSPSGSGRPVRGAGEALHPLVEVGEGAIRSARCSSPTASGQSCRPPSSATLDHGQAAHRAALAELDAEIDAQWRGYDTTEQKTPARTRRRGRAHPTAPPCSSGST